LDGVVEIKGEKKNRWGKSFKWKYYMIRRNKSQDNVDYRDYMEKGRKKTKRHEIVFEDVRSLYKDVRYLKWRKRRKKETTQRKNKKKKSRQ